MTSFSQPFRYLALGDSYTIGEAVPYEENFPSQLVKRLESEQSFYTTFNIAEPVQLIAATGWTTDELMAAIKEKDPQGTFHIVTLLIGVNNQYRGEEKGYTLDRYRDEFAELLVAALRLAGNRTEGVFVVSIPDWGVTPFAEGRDRAQIAMEIDAYNSISQEIARSKNITYIDITPGSRKAKKDSSLIAADGLHPSAKMYAGWVDKLFPQVIKQLF